MKKIIYICVIIIQIFPGIISDCVWYGECNVDEMGRIQNCPYSGPPKPINDTEAIQILKEYCPHYVKDSNVFGCCDTKQLQTFHKKISVAVALAGRCPSCFRSFVGLFCDFMCHPDQDKFMKVATTAKNTKGVDYIDRVTLYVNEEYLNGTYEACRQVMMPSTGQLVFDLMCGSWGSDKCTARRLFSFLGTKSEQVPFSIDYTTSVDVNSSFRLINPPTYPCYKAVDNASVPCSCIDCQESCPAYSEDVASDRASDGEGLMPEYCLFTLIFLVILLAVLLYRTFPVKLLLYVQKSAPTSNSKTIENHLIKIQKNVYCSCKFPLETEGRLVQLFTCLGEICALHPWKILAIGFLSICCFTFGVKYIDITVDPVELWTSSTSQCRQERQYFNEHFGPFYRIQQVVVTAKNLDNVVRNSSDGLQEYGSVFHKQFLLDFKALQDDILKLGGDTDGLQNICIAPLANPGEKLKNTKKCFVQSVWGYFKNTPRLFENVRKNPDGYTVDYLDHIRTCTQNSFNPNCLAEYGGPVNPALALGGFLSPDETLSKSSDFTKANVLTLTIVVQNHLNKEDLKPALKWEQLFIHYMKNYIKNKKDTMEVSFLSERFIEDEVNRQSEANVLIVLISYFAMFLYITLVLGQFRFTHCYLLDSKIVVGLAGVTIVFASVISSVGINSMFAVSVTLIALEVVPFLVLAVGVDNIFVLVHAFDNEPIKKEEPLEKYVGKILGKIGPSILLTGASESGCFFLGSLSTMPCIKSFAMNAAVAIVINFILQLTCFVSILSLNLKRRTENRLDVLCCFQVKRQNEKPTFVLKRIFKNYYTPLVIHKFVRPTIPVLFVVWFFVSALVLPKISRGFEQDAAMPNDSPLLKYFQDLKKNLALGPPTYFVVTGELDLSNTSMQNILCSGQYCDDDSVTNQIYAASRKPNKTYIAAPASSWIDDYFTWLKAPQCCMVGPDLNKACGRSDCKNCDIKFQSNGRPTASDFKIYLNKFLSENPTMSCVKAGHAAYGQAVKISKEDSCMKIGPYFFMAYHSVLKTSEDYYTALAEARTLAENMTRTIRLKTNSDVKVFPYSIFYIFYEQYLTIWRDSIKCISISLITVFVIIFILTYGNIVASLIILITVSMTVVDMLGLLYFLNIQLNALSLVNIVMSIGIAVEFCCHIVTDFCNSTEKTKLIKAKNALNNIGPSVFSGITMTKFIGISVLWFSTSEVFRIYFFQMYLGAVVIGATHSLIFLPTLLSYFGPKTKQIFDCDSDFDYEAIPTQEIRNGGRKDKDNVKAES